MSACVYQQFDKDGALLYIGVSKNPKQRLKVHRSSSSWRKEIAEIRVQHYHSMDVALLVERISIATFGPRYNIAHNKRNIVVPDLTYVDPLLGFYPLKPMLLESSDERKRYLMLKKKYHLIKTVLAYGNRDPIGIARGYYLKVNTILSIFAGVDE